MMANELMRDRWLADPFSDWLDAVPTSDLPTDIEETADAYIARLNVPGVTKDQIDLNYQNQQLTVAVQQPAAAGNHNYLVQERPQAAAKRAFRLPNVVANAITADLTAGVLTITLPKLTQAAADHQIPIA